MLSLGSSKPWPDAMEVLTNNRKMEASAILEYFAPLYDWLIKTNEANGVDIGWDLTYGNLCLKFIIQEMYFNYTISDCPATTSKKVTP